MLDAALPPMDLPAPTAQHAPYSTGPALSVTFAPAAKTSWSDYTVKAGDTLWDIASAHGTTVNSLLGHNSLPQGGRWLMPGQTVKVPGVATSSTQPSSGTSRSTSAASSTSSTSSATITVRSGDTLSGLAAKHGTSVANLSRLNGISSSDFIYPGQKLKTTGTAASSTSTSSSTTSSPTSASSSTSSAGASTITVRPGDTLSGLAAKHGTSVANLSRLNGISSSDFIYPGQKLKTTGSAASTTTQPSASSSNNSTSTSTTTSPSSPPGTSGPWTANNIGDYKLNEDVDNTFLTYTYSSATARAAAANREYLASVPVPNADQTQQMITDTARAHGVDPALMLALASQESGWNQRAVSPANAIGTMQVIPTSGEWASSLVGRDLNLLDPQDNVTAGTVIMRALLRTADTEDEAIGGYYQGLGSVERNGLYSDTKQYVKNIQSLRTRM
ncbi:LysM peptidoglycan-binding domain-containing protein [Ornithinimicrobium sp. Arc0846-15]|nr:LysM peptidoglycan-binding domain-containing protein [Ornithinimicrobium laminariae]